jgi:hypothetical protein
MFLFSSKWKWIKIITSVKIHVKKEITEKMEKIFLQANIKSYK